MEKLIENATQKQVMSLALAYQNFTQNTGLGRCSFL